MPGQIDLDKAIEIADFGDGSEQPIILDYQVDPSEPSVRRLEWNRLRIRGPQRPDIHLGQPLDRDRTVIRRVRPTARACLKGG